MNPVLVLMWTLLGFGVCLFLHECGHLGAALLLGWKPLVFRVGRGRGFTLCKLGDLHVELGLIPTAGWVKAVAVSQERFRLAWLTFTLGGPVATFAIVWGLWCLVHSTGAFAALPIDLRAAVPYLLIVQILLLVMNVLPHTWQIDGRLLPSDGKQIVASLTTSAAHLPQRFLGHRFGEAQIYLQRGQGERARTLLEKLAQDTGKNAFDRQFGLVHFYLKLGLRADAERQMQALLDEAHIHGQPRGRVLDALACLPLYYNYSDLQVQAMSFIDAAISEEPEVITYKGTKGALLVEAGRHEEAVELLREVMAHTRSKSDRALCSYYLALAQRHVTTWERSHELLSGAIQRYPHCIVRGRVERLFWGDPLGRTEGGSAFAEDCGLSFAEIYHEGTKTRRDRRRNRRDAEAPRKDNQKG